MALALFGTAFAASQIAPEAVTVAVVLAGVLALTVPEFKRRHFLNQ